MWTVSTLQVSTLGMCMRTVSTLGVSIHVSRVHSGRSPLDVSILGVSMWTVSTLDVSTLGASIRTVFTLGVSTRTVSSKLSVGSE